MQLKNVVGLLFLLVMFHFLFLNGLCSQEIGGNALIVEMKGEARYVGNRTVILKTGVVIETNDSIYLPVGSYVRVMGEDGLAINYDRSFRVQGSEKRHELLRQLMHQSIKHSDWLASAKEGMRNNIRATSDKDLFMLSPRNTKLTRPPERLTWKASNDSDAKFAVSLRCYETDFSYDALTQNDSFTLATDVSIFPEKQYYWFVHKTDTDLSEMPAAVWFNVLSARDIEKLNAEKNTLKTIMRHDTLSVAFHLLYANLLMSYELYEECRKVLDNISPAESRNPVVQTFYAVIFDKMEMVYESQKYIEFSDQIGR